MIKKRGVFLAPLFVFWICPLFSGMNVQNQIDELTKLCQEMDSEIINEHIQYMYPLLCNCDSDELISHLSELTFLVDEVADDEQLDLKYDIEEKIEEIIDLLES